MWLVWSWRYTAVAKRRPLRPHTLSVRLRGLVVTPQTGQKKAVYTTPTMVRDNCNLVERIFNPGLVFSTIAYNLLGERSV